jgi:hypothetical protein
MAYDGGPGASPPPYGQNGPGYPRPGQGRRRLSIWLGIGGGSVFVAIIVVIGLLVTRQPASSGPSARGAAASRSSARAPLASSAEGPLACVTAGHAAGGSGPWKVIAPQKLCGLPQDNSAAYRQSGKTLVIEYKLLLSLNNAGSQTSSVALEYQSPQGIPNFYRSISFEGLDGRFRPAAAVSAIEEEGYTYNRVPSGPHGGAMECANIEGTENCVWATHTTLGVISIIDTTGDLLGPNVAANAVRIRDALEAAS